LVTIFQESIKTLVDVLSATEIIVEVNIKIRVGGRHKKVGLQISKYITNFMAKACHLSRKQSKTGCAAAYPAHPPPPALKINYQQSQSSATRGMTISCSLLSNQKEKKYRRILVWFTMF